MGGGILCPKCRSMNEPDASFCENCATPLTPSAQPLPVYQQPSPLPSPVPSPPKAGVLILPDNSEIRITASGRVFGKLDLAKASTTIPQDELKFVSRQHFTIYQDQGRYYIEDANSANGTLLNGEEIKGKGRRELKEGDEINPAGAAKIQFRIR